MDSETDSLTLETVTDFDALITGMNLNAFQTLDRSVMDGT